MYFHYRARPIHSVCTHTYTEKRDHLLGVDVIMMRKKNVASFSSYHNIVVHLAFPPPLPFLSLSLKINDDSDVTVVEDGGALECCFHVILPGLYTWHIFSPPHPLCCSFFPQVALSTYMCTYSLYTLNIGIIKGLGIIIQGT